MRIIDKYSHFGGFEWLVVHQPRLFKEITTIVKDFNITQVPSYSFVKQTGLAQIDQHLQKKFIDKRWLSPKHANTKISAMDNEFSNPYNGIFQKSRVLVEVQLAKYSFIEFDLFVKHLGFYIGNSIDVGIEIVPTKKMQSEMSSGPGYYERVIHHIARQGRGAPAVPLVLIGVEP
jgi:hypothetical protein